MSVIDTWKSAGEAGNVPLCLTTLAPTVELVSPITEQFRFTGRSQVGNLLESVFEVIAEYHYEADVRSDTDVFLTARGTVRSVNLHEFQHLELDDDGLIRRITLAMRPLPAASAFVREIGPLIARAAGSPSKARTLTLAGALLDGVVTTGDRRFIPLAAPTDERSFRVNTSAAARKGDGL